MVDLQSRLEEKKRERLIKAFQKHYQVALKQTLGLFVAKVTKPSELLLISVK